MSQNTTPIYQSEEFDQAYQAALKGEQPPEAIAFTRVGDSESEKGAPLSPTDE